MRSTVWICALLGGGALLSVTATISAAQGDRPLIHILEHAASLLALAGAAAIALRLARRERARATLLDGSITRRTADLEEVMADLDDLLAALDRSVIVGITDGKGRIIYANEMFCDISGYTPAELLGADHRLLNSGHHPRRFWTDMYRTVASGGVWRAEVKNRAKDGREYWVDTTIKGVMDADGRLQKVVAIGVDITARKEAEAAADTHVRRLLSSKKILERQRSDLTATTAALRVACEAAEVASRAKSAFLASMSHEIRTPMTAILGFADLLRDPSLPDDARADAAETIRRNGQHLLSVINDILDLSKIEAGKMTVERIECDPVQILRDVADLLRDQAARKGVRLETRLHEPLPRRIASDPVRLRQVLLNLVGNAVKFTTHGSVTVRARPAPAHSGGQSALRITVADTGPGMAPEQVQRLFEPFAQADASMTRRFGGTGLGLAISKHLVEMLGGQITVQSRPGEGSAFTIHLPVCDPAPAPGAQPTAPAAPSAPAPPLSRLRGRILVAEDGPDNQRLLRLHLTRAGADVQIVDNGRLALDAALAAADGPTPFGLIIMDMQMPEMDGYAAAAALRRAGCTLPIVALTAHAMAGERERCLAAGCDDYATKPIDRETLIRTCARWLARRSADAAAAPAPVTAS